MADSRAPAGSVTEALINAVRSRFPGTPLLSGYRKGSITVSGKRSMHADAKAVDLPPIPAIFNWIRETYPDSHELIFSPMGDKQIYRGRSHVYTGAVKATHFDHIHWSRDTAPGGGGTTPVSLPTEGVKIPVVDGGVTGLVDSFQRFFSEGNGARRLVMIAVGGGLIWVSISITFGRKLSGVARGIIGR